MINAKDLEFLQRLATLLNEYNAEINIDCDEGSDLSGISLTILRCNNEIFSSCYSIDSMDINDFLKKMK